MAKSDGIMRHLSDFVEGICKQVPKLCSFAIHYLNVRPPLQSTLQKSSTVCFKYNLTILTITDSLYKLKKKLENTS